MTFSGGYAGVVLPAIRAAGLDDAALLVVLADNARLQRALVADAAALAGEIAVRSAAALGSAGLAQSLGVRTPEELVKVTAGVVGRDAALLVRLGRLTPAEAPWLGSAISAFRGGTLSGAALEAIRRGLGEPSATVTVSDLTSAATSLIAVASTVDPDRLAGRARILRDQIDTGGLESRAAARRDGRCLRVFRRADGMTVLNWVMDPETGALVTELFDRATSPKRGGVRFVDGVDRALAERLTADERTTDQLASDTFLGLLQHGADADDSELLGTGAAVIRVLISKPAADTSGHGFIEGQPDPITSSTIDRLACDGVTVTATFDTHGMPLDFGREQRLFTRRQKQILATKWGGCVFGDCNRPPSWTEAHHIRHWKRDHGRTDIADGILLCRHHHLLIHNNHWDITRTGNHGENYWLVLPSTIDPTRQPRAIESRSRAYAELVAARFSGSSVARSSALRNRRAG